MARVVLIFLAGLSCAPAALAEINNFDGKVITLRGYGEVPSYQLQFQSKDSGQKVSWKPNIHTQTGADISINKFIGFGFGWANSDGQNSAIVYGKTNYNDYRLGFNFDRYRLELNYNVYRGFYVDNTSDVDPAVAATGNKLQDPTLEAANASLNFTWIMQPQTFSESAALEQDKRQEAWGGAWLLGLSASRLSLQSDTRLIPATVSPNFGTDQNVQNATFYTLAVRGGYGYTFAWTKKIFTSLIADFGLGFEYRKFGNTQNETTSGGVAEKIDPAMAIGYNGDDFLISATLTSDNTTYSINSMDITSSLSDFKIAIGGHF